MLNKELYYSKKVHYHLQQVTSLHCKFDTTGHFEPRSVQQLVLLSYIEHWQASQFCPSCPSRRVSSELQSTALLLQRYIPATFKGGTEILLQLHAVTKRALVVPGARRTAHLDSSPGKPKMTCLKAHLELWNHSTFSLIALQRQCTSTNTTFKLDWIKNRITGFSLLPTEKK